MSVDRDNGSKLTMQGSCGAEQRVHNDSRDSSLSEVPRCSNRDKVQSEQGGSAYMIFGFPHYFNLQSSSVSRPTLTLLSVGGLRTSNCGGRFEYVV